MGLQNTSASRSFRGSSRKFKNPRGNDCVKSEIVYLGNQMTDEDLCLEAVCQQCSSFYIEDNAMSAPRTSDDGRFLVHEHLMSHHILISFIETCCTGENDLAERK